MSILVIAVAKKDILFEGDLVSKRLHCDTPSIVIRHTEMCPTQKRRFPRFDFHKRIQSSLGLHCGNANQKIIAVLSSCHVPYAQTTGYFLVLVPLIAFCIRCIMDSIQNRVGDLKCEAAKKPEVHHHKTRSRRWKFALSDERDPDILDAELRPDLNHLPGDQHEMPYEDMSNAYMKLERDYQKFLSECGISEWGYWRGGGSTE